MAFNPDDEDDDEKNAALEALSPQDISEGNQAIAEYEKNNPDEDLAKTAATTAPDTSPVNTSKSILNTLLQPKTSSTFGVSGDSTDAIINAFKPSQGGGFWSGVGKIGEYLNTPEGKEIIGGLISKQNPYAGAYMVNNAEAQKQALMARNAPISNTDKMKMAVELAKTSGDLNLELRKMGISSQEFQQTYGMKGQELANEKAKTNIQQQQADTEQQRLAVEQQRAATEEKKANQDLNQMPVDKLIETYKGKISPEDAATLQNAAKTGTQGNYSIKRSVAGTLLPGGYSFKVVPNQQQAAGQTSTGNRFTIRPVAPQSGQM